MNHFKKYLIEEFAEDYQEGTLTRREALKLLAGVTGSLVLANSILAACAPLQESPATSTGAPSTESPTMPAPTDTAAAATPTEPTAGSADPSPQPTLQSEFSPHGTVSPDDPAVQGGDIEFPGDGATLLGYQASPALSQGKLPVILVCHENRGLTDHIRDVTRRLAKAGYVSLAVDLLSRQGGTSALDSSDVPGVLGNTSPDQFVQDFYAGWRFLQSLDSTQAERVGMVGFCFGGGVTWTMATRMPELKAAVPFYGPHPPLEDVNNIQAAVLAIYGENDQRINAGIPEIEGAMLASDKVFQKIIYPNAGHAFHNDTSDRYAPEAARDAWAQTLKWFLMYV